MMVVVLRPGNPVFDEVYFTLRFTITGLYSSVSFYVGSIFVLISQVWKRYLNKLHMAAAKSITLPYTQSLATKSTPSEVSMPKTKKQVRGNSNRELLRQAYAVQRSIEQVGRAGTLSVGSTGGSQTNVLGQSVLGMLTSDLLSSKTLNNHNLNQIKTVSDRYKLEGSGLLTNMQVDYLTSNTAESNSATNSQQFALNAKLFQIDDNLNIAKQNR